MSKSNSPDCFTGRQLQQALRLQEVSVLEPSVKGAIQPIYSFETKFISSFRKPNLIRSPSQVGPKLLMSNLEKLVKILPDTSRGVSGGSTYNCNEASQEPCENSYPTKTSKATQITSSKFYVPTIKVPEVSIFDMNEKKTSPTPQDNSTAATLDNLAAVKHIQIRPKHLQMHEASKSSNKEDSSTIIRLLPVETADEAEDPYTDDASKSKICERKRLCQMPKPILLNSSSSRKSSKSSIASLKKRRVTFSKQPLH